MTEEEFIKELDSEGYSYKIEGDKIVITHKAYVFLNSLTSIPSGVEFKNGGGVYLNSLTSLPPGLEFKNEGHVFLKLLKTLPHGFVFENKGSVSLEALTSLPLGVEFKNGGYVYLPSLIGGQFNYWSGNIEGIDSNRLLNVMIKRGMFI